ncbi:MAG: hypothetical protein H8D34_01540 [Chloroflexi bacterium]|nr:hypothetical protein [Chloroflexota bacterium]
MVERGSKIEPAQTNETILSRDFVETILQGARENLTAHGSLVATLFLKLDAGERAIVPLSISETPEEKQLYFTLLGLSIRENGRDIYEAILISESWYVAPSDGKYPDLAPSNHPGRKEAITLAGRDSMGLQFVFAIQPFERDSQNQPVFESLALEQFDDQPDSNCDTSRHRSGFIK